MNKEIMAWLDDHDIPAFEQDDLLRLINKHMEIELNYEREKYRNIIDAIPERMADILDRAIVKYK